MLLTGNKNWYVHRNMTSQQAVYVSDVTSHGIRFQNLVSFCLVIQYIATRVHSMTYLFQKYRSQSHASQHPVESSKYGLLLPFVIFVLITQHAKRILEPFCVPSSMDSLVVLICCNYIWNGTIWGFGNVFDMQCVFCLVQFCENLLRLFVPTKA